MNIFLGTFTTHPHGRIDPDRLQNSNLLIVNVVMRCAAATHTMMPFKQLTTFKPNTAR